MLRLIPTRLMIVSMLVAGTAAVLWAAEEINPIGRPKEFLQAKSRMFGVWYEDEMWHLRATSGKGVKLEFTGTVEVDGGSITPNYSALEKARKKANSDAVQLSKGGRVMEFRFVTSGTADGIDFKVGKNAKTVKFTLRTADDDDPRFIFIGGKSAHPQGGTFSFPAHPTPEPAAMPEKTPPQ